MMVWLERVLTGVLFVMLIGGWLYAMYLAMQGLSAALR